MREGRSHHRVRKKKVKFNKKPAQSSGSDRQGNDALHLTARRQRKKVTKSSETGNQQRGGSGAHRTLQGAKNAKEAKEEGERNPRGAGRSRRGTRATRNTKPHLGIDHRSTGFRPRGRKRFEAGVRGDKKPASYWIGEGSK